MLEEIKLLFGTAAEAARRGDVSRQLIRYWCSAPGFRLEDAGHVRSKGGRVVGFIPTRPAAIKLAKSKLAWLGPDVVIAPAELLGPVGRFLPMVNGRDPKDAAPAGDWLKWLV